MALNPALVGREYHQAETHIIYPEQLQRHRRAMVAQSFAPFASTGFPLPASLSLRLCQGALTAVLLDGDLGLDSMRLVLVGLDGAYLQAPSMETQTSASATVEAITSTPEGERLVLDVRVQQPNLGSWLQARVEFLERNPRPKGDHHEEDVPLAHPNAEDYPVYFSHEIPLHMNVVREMLDELGEFNPIYRDEELAQLANLPAPCVPPSYVFAIAHHAVEQALGENAHPIKRFRGRFARSPWVGDTLRIVVGSQEGRNGFVDIRDGANRKVFTDATFEVAVDAPRAET